MIGGLKGFGGYHDEADDEQDDPKQATEFIHDSLQDRLLGSCPSFVFSLDI
jgi:hypothetical protein